MDDDYGPYHSDTIGARAKAEKVTAEAKAKVWEASAKDEPRCTIHLLVL